MDKTAKYMSSQSATCLYCLGQLTPQAATVNPNHAYEVGQQFYCPCGKSSIWTNSLRNAQGFLDYLDGKSPSWAPNETPRYTNGFCNDRFCGFTYTDLRVLENGIEIPGQGRGELVGNPDHSTNDRIGYRFDLEDPAGDESNLMKWWADHRDDVEAYLAARARVAFTKLAGPERLEYFKKQYPNFEASIERLAKEDPTAPQYKYLDWSVRSLLGAADARFQRLLDGTPEVLAEWLGYSSLPPEKRKLTEKEIATLRNSVGGRVPRNVEQLLKWEKAVQELDFDKYEGEGEYGEDLLRERGLRNYEKFYNAFAKIADGDVTEIAAQVRRFAELEKYLGKSKKQLKDYQEAS